MRSNYKKLGRFIQVVDTRNKENRKDNLLGVSTQKVFIDSVANTVGTDFKKYKIVRKHQFTYVPDTSRRGDKMGIAMLESLDQALVSQAYTVFEVKDSNLLDPEYLMMWFRRPEFDRYARFKSHGSVREIFDWQEMCDVELPVPTIEKQREIVREYNVVNDRITLNEQLTQKLEDTAQAIYKQWFVDFEFPISKEYAESIGKPELEGKSYKSSGGEMEYCEELDQDVPVNWKVDTLNTYQLDVSDGNYSSKYPKRSEFLDKGVPFIRGTDFDGYFIEPSNFRYISEEKHSQIRKGHTKSGDVLITTRGAYIGKYAFIPEKYVGVNINSQLVRLNGKENYPQFYLGLLFSSKMFTEELEGAITGSAQPQLSVTNLLGMKLLKPSILIIKAFCSAYKSIHCGYLIKYEEIILLRKLRVIILSKMAVS